MTPTTSEPSPSVQTSRRKSPRLQQQVQDRTVDLAADDHPVQSSATLNMSNLTIDSTSGNGAGVDPPRPARRRLWNSDLARSINKIGKARKQRDVEEYGAMRIIHPSKLPTMKTKNGRLLDDSKELFFEASDAFVRHHAEFNCANFQRKNYRTGCSCLKRLLTSTNSSEKMKQVNECLWTFFTREKKTQKLVAKEWIRSVLFSDRKPQKNKVDVSYILPGVFYNAPQSSLVTSLPGLVNTRPYKVCLNSISLLFNYG